jgi:hypothetical protein
MSYGWIGALVLRAYPADFRSARGEEMLGTLLDAREDSGRAFVRGLVSLLIRGLRARARVNAQVGAPRLIADGFCLAGVLRALAMLTDEYHGFGGAWPAWTLVVLFGVPVFAVLGRDRLGGLCGLIVAGYFLTHLMALIDPPHDLQLIGHPDILPWSVDRWAGPCVCFVVMLLKPRKRPRDARRAALLIPIVVLFLMPELATGVILLIALPVVGIIMLPVDPRLAIASAVLWAGLFASATANHVRLGLVTLPIVLLAMLLAVAQVRRASRDLPS